MHLKYVCVNGYLMTVLRNQNSVKENKKQPNQRARGVCAQLSGGNTSSVDASSSDCIQILNNIISF